MTAGDLPPVRREAARRWLEAREVLAILADPAQYGLTVCHEVPQAPPSGSLFLFDRNSTKSERRSARGASARKQTRAHARGGAVVACAGHA
jgi:hypothetical protein